MLRCLDVVISILGLIFAAPFMAGVTVAGFICNRRPVFFSQIRVGKHKEAFVLFKLRTLPKDTPWVGSHLLDESSIDKYGTFLRRTKLDELPQLWNVLKGDMSIVGPRPCLFTQIDVIESRDKKGVFDVKPGITGLAQIRGVDMSNPLLLARMDKELIDTLSLRTYLKTIYLTFQIRGSEHRPIGL